MEKVPLFEGLLNEPMETRCAMIDDFAAHISFFNAEALNSLLTCYHSARVRNDNEMILALGSGSYAHEAACILRIAGVRSVLLDEECPAAFETMFGFLIAGWRASAVWRWFSDDGIIPMLRLTSPQERPGA